MLWIIFFKPFFCNVFFGHPVFVVRATIEIRGLHIILNIFLNTSVGEDDHNNFFKSKLSISVHFGSIGICMRKNAKKSNFFDALPKKCKFLFVEKRCLECSETQEYAKKIILNGQKCFYYKNYIFVHMSVKAYVGGGLRTAEM